MKLLLSLLFGLLFVSLAGQNDLVQQEKELAYHADVMVHAAKSVHRTRASAEFREAFLNALQDPESFSYPFDSLEWVSKIEDPGQSFRLFTWGIDHGPDSVVYYGFFQSAEGMLIELKDSGSKSEDYAYESFTSNNWLGQVYFDLHTFIHHGETCILLLGARIEDRNTRMKTVEPLIWDGIKLIFGKELFYKNSRHGASRLFLEYHATASASFQFDNEDNRIVFDHLVPVINPYESNKTILVPDGTIEAYTLENGRWDYDESVLDEKYSAPPVPQPLKKEKDVDIFGRPN